METILKQKLQTKEISGESIFNPYKFKNIYNRIEKINPNSSRNWGTMNSVQMLNHLKIATASGLEIYKLQDESSFFQRTIIKCIALYVLSRLPKNTKAAKGFNTEMNLPLEWNLEKQQVLLILKKAHTSNKDNYPHPMFGTMSKAKWGRLIYRHFDHHLRQFSA